MTKSPKKQVIIRLTPEEHEKIKAAAEKDRRSVQSLFRCAMDLYLKEIK